MARAQASPASPAKEPGRFKQMWQVFQMTRRYDKSSVWWMALGFFGPIIAAVLLSIFVGGGVLAVILYIITGVLAGMLLFLLILGRKAEKAAYSQLKGQPGAVGVVLRSSLKRGWRGSEMPVAVNGKTQDAVYRAVGRGGVVLIGEGPKSRTKRMLEDERRKVQRVLPNVPVGFVTVGPDPDSVELHKLAGSLRRFKKTLTKTEILAVSNRLDSLGQTSMPIPKGVDPFKVRAQRPR